MAIALVQHTTGFASGGSPSATFGANTTAGNFLVAELHLNGVTVPSAPAGWTLAGSHVNGSTCLSALYYSENIAGGTATYAFTTSAHSASLILAEYSGIATSASLDQTGSGATFSNHVSAQSKATTSANELWVFGFGAQNSHTISGMTAGYTLVDTTGGTGGDGWMYAQIVSSTGTAAPSCTLNSSDNWDAVQATFIAAAGGGSIVSGSATLVANEALTETAAGIIASGATLEADAALVSTAATILASGDTLQANAALTSSAATLIATGDTLQSNAALVEHAATLLASGATLQSNSGLIVTGHVIANGVALAANAALSEASALLITAATEQSNAALVATGGIAGSTVNGSATLVSNAALSATGQVVAGPVALAANAALPLAGAHILSSAPVQANAGLVETAARLIVATPQPLTSNAALSEAAVLIAAALMVMQGNAALIATGSSASPSQPGSCAATDAQYGSVSVSDALLPGSVTAFDAALGSVTLSDLVAELVGV
jgi:hypothetical protein